MKLHAPRDVRKASEKPRRETNVRVAATIIRPRDVATSGPDRRRRIELFGRSALESSTRSSGENVAPPSALTTAKTSLFPRRPSCHATHTRPPPAATSGCH